MKKLEKVKNLIESLYKMRNLQQELCPDYMFGIDETEDKKERKLKLKEYLKVSQEIEQQLKTIRELYGNKLNHLSDISLTLLLFVYAGVYNYEIRNPTSSILVPYILGNKNIDKLPELMNNIKNGDLKQYLKLEFKHNTHKISIQNEDDLQELFLKWKMNY